LELLVVIVFKYVVKGFEIPKYERLYEKASPEKHRRKSIAGKASPEKHRRKSIAGKASPKNTSLNIPK
jgi:hypothetical protein